MIQHYDYSKLEGRIIEMFGSRSEYSTKSGVCRTSLSKKLNNKIGFTQIEMYQASKLLQFKNGVKDIPVYFFNRKV